MEHNSRLTIEIDGPVYSSSSYWEKKLISLIVTICHGVSCNNRRIHFFDHLVGEYHGAVESVVNINEETIAFRIEDPILNHHRYFLSQCYYLYDYIWTWLTEQTIIKTVILNFVIEFSCLTIRALQNDQYLSKIS